MIKQGHLLSSVLQMLQGMMLFKNLQKPSFLVLPVMVALILLEKSRKIFTFEFVLMASLKIFFSILEAQSLLVPKTFMTISQVYFSRLDSMKYFNTSWLDFVRTGHPICKVNIHI